MGTVDGTKALGRADDIGSLLVGKLADFVVLNPVDGAGVLPFAAEDVCDWIIDSATPSAVRQVFVEGDCVIDNGRHPVLDEQKLTDDLLARSLGRPPSASAENLDLFGAAEPYIQALLVQTNQYVAKPTPDA
jgi:cytosine/adenosine deaminase-related metal-dependent hydrolase